MALHTWIYITEVMLSPEGPRLYTPLSFSLNQSRTEGIIGSPAHKMCSRFHMPDLTQGQSGQQPESRHLDVLWIRKQWVSCFPSQGFMFSHSGFHVFPRRVSCFPLLCDRSGVSCFPVTAGFMFSPHGFHVFLSQAGFMFSHALS